MQNFKNYSSISNKKFFSSQSSNSTKVLTCAEIVFYVYNCILIIIYIHRTYSVLKIVIFSLNLSSKFPHDMQRLPETNKSHSSSFSITVLHKFTNEYILEHSFIHSQTFIVFFPYSRQRWTRLIFQLEIIYSLCTVKDENLPL